MKAGLFASTLTAFAAAGFAPLDAPSGLEGGYVTAPATDMTACATACEEDGLCMSWAYAEGQCSLSAIAPSQAPGPGLVWGPSSRAPRFGWIEAAPAPGAAEAPSEAAAPAPANPFEPVRPADALLGGPDGPDGLRLRIADDRL